VSSPAERPALAAARQLQRIGSWDLALDLLEDEPPDAAVAALRAATLVDRHWWRLDQAEQAEAAVATLAADGADPALSALLRGQLLYTRVLFAEGPEPGDDTRAEAAFAEAAAAPAGGGGAGDGGAGGGGPAAGETATGRAAAGRAAAGGAAAGPAEANPDVRAWATFWLGVLAENLRHDQPAATARYAEALPLAREQGDRLLESYVVRHQGFHLLAEQPAEGLALLRRSLYLRAGLGARPQVAAAEALLADALPPGDEPDTLRDAALHRPRARPHLAAGRA
jgi:hypothetical protein